MPVGDGLTCDQRFLIGCARAWRWKLRDESRGQLLKRDFHPPTNVWPQIVRNVDARYTAFKVQPGDRRYLTPEDRVRPW